MIKDERQNRITKAQTERFSEALRGLVGETAEGLGVHLDYVIHVRGEVGCADWGVIGGCLNWDFWDLALVVWGSWLMVVGLCGLRGLGCWFWWRDCAMFRRAVRPGGVLKDELAEFARWSLRIDVAANRVSQIILGQRSVTGDSALRLGLWFGVDAQFWLNLQSQYDLVVAERRMGDDVRGLPTAVMSR